MVCMFIIWNPYLVLMLVYHSEGELIITVELSKFVEQIDPNLVGNSASRWQTQCLHIFVTFTIEWVT